MCILKSVLKEGAVFDVCVVHLVRKCNGIEPFRNFLESYRSHPAGLEHELLLLYKGFDGEVDCASYEALAADILHSSLIVTDQGFDLYAYFLAASTLPNRYLCFVNSFSVIMADEWLVKLWRVLQADDVGLVGVSGSWGSISTGLQNNKRFSVIGQFIYNIYRWIKRLYLGRYFCPFPNYHIRTNGLMIERALLLSMQRGSLQTKMSAYRLESGNQSLTRQVMAMGLGVRVVDCNGVAYAETEWNRSDTFWHGNQSQLMISDNQTRKFATADVNEKSRLTFFAWGEGVVDSKTENA